MYISMSKAKQMDLETENRLAAMLMREAAELRRQSEQEGVLAYLRKPNVRTRPNSRFLTATVRGVQQANRAVEVNEMWRVRQKELELDKRAKGTMKDKSSGYKSHRDLDSSRSPGRHGGFDNSSNDSASCSSKRAYELDKGGSKDKESVDKHYRDISNRNPSRSTSRHGDFQEPEYNPEPEGLKMKSWKSFFNQGPSEAEVLLVPEWTRLGLTFHLTNARERRVIYGPERPSSGKSDESSEEEFHDERPKKRRNSCSGNSDKEHTNKRRTKEKSKHKKEKKRKHRH